MRRRKESTLMQLITPFLWFDTQAEDAANYYVSIFGNSRILKIVRYGAARRQGQRPGAARHAGNAADEEARHRGTAPGTPGRRVRCPRGRTVEVPGRQVRKWLLGNGTALSSPPWRPSRAWTRRR